MAEVHDKSKALTRIINKVAIKAKLNPADVRRLLTALKETIVEDAHSMGDIFGVPESVASLLLNKLKGGKNE